MTDLFKLASRKRFRFESPVGELSTEQLWDLPLQSARSNKPSLNDVAVRLARQSKDLGEESFVDTGSNPAKTEVEQKLELVKAIIADRQAENAAATAKAAAASQAARIDEIIAAKKDKALEELSVEELEAMKQKL